MKSSKVYEELSELDRKRVQLRHEYRQQISQATSQGQESEGFIYFPKSVISKDNEQLLKGLPWLYNGFIIHSGNVTMAVDPGVDFVLRLTEDDFDLSSINTVYLSHLHIDHTADANTLLEWTVRARKDTKIYAPKSVYETRAISDFHAGINTKFPVNHSSEVIDSETGFPLSDATILRFIELQHSVECFGFTLTTPGGKICYISDTGYAHQVKPSGSNVPKDVRDITEPTGISDITSYNESIKHAVQDSDILIVNIDSFLHGKNSKDHLSVIDLVHMVKGSSLSHIIITHINPAGEPSYENWGAKIAQYVQHETNIPTAAIPQEGYKYSLNI